MKTSPSPGGRSSSPTRAARCATRKQPTPRAQPLSAWNAAFTPPDSTLPSAPTDVTATLPLQHSRLSRLVIREVYYGGCKGADGKSYIKDSYIILHNNSEEVVSLDSLCLGTIAPVTSAKPSPWMLYTDMKRLPVNMMGWQFVAEDKERLVLPPGGSVTVAMHAVNHRGEECRDGASRRVGPDAVSDDSCRVGARLRGVCGLGGTAHE